jgi:hypothetical protein
MAVKLIHKNSGVKNKPVLPSQIEYGEISINWHDSGPFIQVKDASNEIVRVGGVIIQDNQPALAQKGAFWLSGTELYLYNGTAWILISGGGGGTGGDFIACTDGGLLFDATDQCWQIDEYWLLEWAQNNAPGSVTPGDGALTIFDADGNILGVFTANQTGSTEVILPASGGGTVNWIDIEDKPTTFPPSSHLHSYNDLEDKPTIGDGTITIKDSDDSTVGSFTVNQVGDAEITLPEVVIPESLHPKGFINVDDRAPDNPEHGDIYIQHKDDGSDGAANSTFAPGIAFGAAVPEGTFVMFGVDDLWHAGGNANSTQVQSDWEETNNTEPSFIKNKPCVYECNTYIPSLSTLP